MKLRTTEALDIYLYTVQLKDEILFNLLIKLLFVFEFQYIFISGINFTRKV